MIVEVDTLLQCVGLMLFGEIEANPSAEQHVASAALDIPGYLTRSVVHMRSTPKTGNVTVVVQMYAEGSDTPTQTHSYEENVVDYIPNLVAGMYHRTPYGYRGTING